MNLWFRYLGRVWSFREKIVTIGEEGERPPVILVHGLLHRGFFMENLAVYLQREDRRLCILYDYRTSSGGIEKHAARFAEFLKPELRRCGKTDIVTHSMGGLLTRLALEKLDAEERSRIHRIVMLAPPHYGSPAASAWCRVLPFAGWILPPLPELREEETALVHRLPVPEGFPIGVIAGSRDREVPVASTRLPGAADHIVVDSAHSFIMNKSEAQRQTLAFLRDGRFERQ